MNDVVLIFLNGEEREESDLRTLGGGSWNKGHSSPLNLMARDTSKANLMDNIY
jgi:hypothetical protein